MPITTLNNFGVPINGGKQGPMLQPKKKFLFRIRFLNFGNIGNQAVPLTLNAQTVTLPKLTQEAQAVHAYNSIAYYAGKHSWDTVTVTARDDVTNTVNRNIDAQIQRQMDHINQTGYRAATDYKFTSLIEVMDGGNDAVLETWQLEGCFLTNYEPEGMDYTNTGDAKIISLTIRYDNATHYDESGNLLMISPSSDPASSVL